MSHQQRLPVRDHARPNRPSVRNLAGPSFEREYQQRREALDLAHGTLQRFVEHFGVRLGTLWFDEGISFCEAIFRRALINAGARPFMRDGKFEIHCGTEHTTEAALAVFLHVSFVG